MTMAKAGATFDLLLDKATSHLLLDTDWEAILQICDLVQQGDTQAKYAIGAIKKKLKDNNPHVALYALEVLESVVKNCGQAARDEVASKQTMEELKDLVRKQTTDPNVRFKILYLIQAWAQAFRTEPKCKVVQDAYQNLKSDGHIFPEFKESDAMFFSAEKVPRWSDGETCHRCRAQFGLLINKRHHCRNCGQAFCSKCSSKTSFVTKVAVDKEVRVCDPCYELLNAPKRKNKTKAVRGCKAPDSIPMPPQVEAAPSAPSSQRRDEQLQAEEELQLAIALSQSEAEDKERMKHKYSYYAKAEPASSLAGSALYLSPVNASAPSDEDAHPELARYLNRTYWERKQEDACRGPTPSAPAPTPLAELLPPVDGHVPLQSDAVAGRQQYQRNDNGGASEDDHHQQFLKALQNNVTTFLNRIRSNQMRGRSIANDSAVLSLFQSIDNMHPQLQDLLNQLEEKRLYYEGLQDQLTQVFDAQAALNALRDEHREKVRRDAEEAERQRKVQLAHKLEMMRQKKQESLEMQRQQAIQRLQEQESERQIRLEMQKHTVQMRAQMPAFPQPYGQMQSGAAAYPSYEGTMHGVYLGQPGQTGVPGGQYHQATDANVANAYGVHHAADATGGQPAPPPSQAPPPPTGNPASSGYQPAPPQGYLVSQGQGLTSMSQAAAVPADGMAYMGYQPFAVQGARSAPPGGHEANALPPPQQLVYQQREALPSGGHRQPQQQQTPQAEAQLISFD